jgi:Subtilisin inhibitor-like
MFRLAAILATVVALAPACVGGGSAEPGTELTVLYERQTHASVLDRVTLTCDPAGGNLSDPAAACRRLHADPDRYVGQVMDVACIGPVIRWSVTISGHLDGRKVSHSYDVCDYPQASAWTDLGGTKLKGVVPAVSP